MTFDEFKIECEKEIREEMGYASMAIDDEYQLMRGRVKGIEFAAKQFLPIRYSNELNNLKNDLLKILRVQRREDINTENQSTT